LLDLILSSCPPEQAQAIADALIERQVAACVSIVPAALSTYRWQGAVHHDAESLLLVKVPTELRAACLAALQEVHPYTVPELVVVSAAEVGAGYLAWAREVTAASR
jgi:periplasmic divalent cation tolerance protein